MALCLGSDVPFFIKGGAAWISGRGEHIISLAQPPEYVVLLVKPPFFSDTAGAFSALSQYRKENSNFKANQCIKPDLEGINNIWTSPPEKWPFFNDFMEILPHREIFKEIIGELKNRGSLYSGLSGSGSCCFGLFNDKKTAQTAEAAFNANKNREFFTQLTFFLAPGADPVLE